MDKKKKQEITPEKVEAMLDASEFRMWLAEKGDLVAGNTVSRYACPLGCFLYHHHALSVLIEDDEIVVPGGIRIPHKPWSKKFVSLLRNEYAGHDWVSGYDAIHILDRAVS